MFNNRNKWCLSIGCVGRDLCYTLVSLFLLTYIQYTGLLENDLQFGILTVIIVLTRIWDAINDPMMGTIISNTRTKFGRFRPWLLGGAILNAIFLVCMFSLRFDSGWINLVVVGISYLLWETTFTMNDVSYWSLLPALTSKKKERDTLTTLVAVFASIGAFASGGLVPFFQSGDAINVYRNFSLIFSCVFIACQLLVFFGVHDNMEDKFMLSKAPEKLSKEETTTLKKMFQILIKNDQLIVMAIVVLLSSLGSAILNAFGQNFFYFKFSYEIGGDYMFFFTVVYAVGTLVSQGIYSTLAKKFKRDQLLKASVILLSIGYVLFFIFGNVDLGNDFILLIIYCFIGIFIFAGQGIFYLTMLVMLTNTIEYDEWKHGKNNAEIAFSVRPFMVKLASAIQYGVVALTLIVCGLYATTNEIGSLELQLNKNEITQEMFNTLVSEKMVCNSTQMLGLTFIMTIVPVILYVACYFIIKKKYIITEEYYANILNDLDKRHIEDNN